MRQDVSIDTAGHMVGKTHLLCPELMIAEMGCASRLNVMIMLKIWMLLPLIQAMKHMKPMFLMGAVARAKRACNKGKSS
jgi:hypothetical protein